MELLKFLITFVVFFAIIYPLAQKNRKKREANAPQVSPAFEANVGNISEALVRASAAEAGRNMPANYLMDSSSVRLSYWVGHRREQKYYSYSDLSGGAVYTLNSTEQIHMAEVFGRYLATSGYVSARNVWPGGRGVQVK